MINKEEATVTLKHLLYYIVNVFYLPLIFFLCYVNFKFFTGL